ncbi:hypothetical protein QQ020_04395 [Fulvivirgaceae bacterium BMA12]|uniref:T9SS C-terminal target domain-containing protein n=1 Tax=Agaribacillus aureus TaxID=3051825 RepID=A0ABT8L0M3_9BACT|nr:hypothetical protein [Fulvivirgaceae bacterium BMA12]
MKADVNFISDSCAIRIFLSAALPKAWKILPAYLSILILLNSACTDEAITEKIADYGDFKVTERKIGQQLFNVVEGSISRDFTFSNNIGWILEGGVFVNPGSTLTIEPGTRIYGAFNDKTSFLSVLRGAKIMADGTADKPILFTTIRAETSIPQPGDWGGIIINGSAPINVPGGEAEGEGGTGMYGGQDASDNSGILRYVIVEYGGKVLGTDNELNNISLNGLGSETTVEYVEALYGKDDGIEIFGGHVNIKYAVSMGNSDDCIDWTHGWRGKGQFWVVRQDPFSGDRGIEADNNEEDFLATPFSEPVISNITILGADDGDGGNIGIRLRHGTKGKIYNAIISQFTKHGFETQDSSQTYIETGEVLLENSIVFDNATANPDGKNFKNSEQLEENPSNSTSRSLISLDGYVGVIVNGAINPSDLDPWFSSVNYIGAVPEESNWTEKWVNQLR